MGGVRQGRECMFFPQLLALMVVLIPVSVFKALFSQKGKNLSEGLASLAKQGMWLSLPSELSPNQTIWIQPLSEDLKENVGD